MTTPALPAVVRIDGLTAALDAEVAAGLTDGIEIGDFERDPFTTMTHGELRAILAAAKRLVEAERLLRQREWIADSDGRYYVPDYCPTCRFRQPGRGTRKEGHAEGCEYAAFLSPTEEPR